MTESRRYGLAAQLDINQILLDAQHRWLRPAEICEILRNYTKFRIAPEPPDKPPSGSLFLFDRKVLRYFRKDGHSWRKKKDGKTVKEAHERLKSGSIDVLHCYYAHGEENENFQRRSYWLLEEEHSNIVLVHYREVKGNRANFNRVREAAEAVPNSQDSDDVRNSEVESSVSSRINPYNYQVTSQTTDTQASEHEDAESAYNNPSSSGFHTFLALQSGVTGKTDGGLSDGYYPVPFPDDYQGRMSAISGMDFHPLGQVNKERQDANVFSTYESQKNLDFSPWQDDLGNCNTGFQSAPYQQTSISNQRETMMFRSGKENEFLGQALADGFGRKTDAVIYSGQTNEWQISETGSLLTSILPVEQKYQGSSYHMTDGAIGGVGYLDLLNPAGPLHGSHAEHNNKYTESDRQVQWTYAEDSLPKSESEKNLIADGKFGNSPLKQPLIGGLMKEGLKKLDSFDRWVNNELEDVNESHINHTSESYWDAVEAEDGTTDSSIAPQDRLDTYMLSPSLSQDQLFSIIDFSPNWAYSGSEIKVLITGKFLKTSQDVKKCKWSCMFGEVEVPAEIIADGVLRCHTPVHKPGRVPFYVTCSNRLACSEVREFDYRADNAQDVDIPDIYCGSSDEVILRMRFAQLLCPDSFPPANSPRNDLVENSHLISKISSLLKEDDSDWEELLRLSAEEEFYPERVKEHLLQKLLKEKLLAWLLQKITEGGKGASVLDEEGQGVLHFAGALGYDWAIPPTLVAGVSVNFRDVNGWTALHWAASCGRERTVGFLISRGAAPGALTDPTPLYPSGRTPADLAYDKRHKGIAGFLAESSLSDHLSALQVKDANARERDGGESTRSDVVKKVTERTATPVSDGDLPHGLSLKDSLAAVCNATQAAARIHQVFRAQSFQRKQLKEYGDGKLEMSDERALSLVAVKSRLGPHDGPVQTAAIRIQNKYRSWKGRKEYLTLRQHVVKIQAHVRGHQVRKNYRKIIWSVGILDKVILRWRRKGSGLRGFKKEAIAQNSNQEPNTSTSKEDDDDFLKEGRKQTEERLQKALARVKSMVQYPEARDQYRRLLNVVTEMKENKDVYDKALNNAEEGADDFDDMIDIDAFLDDTYMPPAS